MNNKDKAFLRWAKIRRKGAFRYVVANTLMISLGVVLGRAIGFYYFNGNPWPSDVEWQLLVPLLVSVTVLSLVYLVVWHLRESSFEKEIYSREREHADPNT
ncbi:hypothetical protein [Enterovibrio calviensis]|uniref:hypothetical protein n=1 Tax=Enterovibrio calviensis TaxID=91359 RepID=UPI000485B988|nr:hypothetical protein [Enterovibrio calviensis]